MKDLMGMMSKAKELQEKMQSLQEEIAETEVAGTAGGDLVSVIATGKGTLVSVKIDPSLAKPDELEILEDLIVAAVNDARAKSEALAADKMQEATAGLPLPPGMKLPF